MTITLYNPPKHNVSTVMFKTFFQTPVQRFIAGDGYNAKNRYWGARITNPEGIELTGAINELHLDNHATAEPTYWPTHDNRRPDFLDFVSKG